MSDSRPTASSDPNTTPDAERAPAARPVLRIVRGAPTDEELAALVAVLTSAGAPARSTGTPKSRPVGRWADPSRQFRTQARTGPGAWRATGRPS